MSGRENGGDMNKQFLGAKGDEPIFTLEKFNLEQERRIKEIERQKRPEVIARAKQIDDERAQLKTLNDIEIAKRAYQVDTKSTVEKIAAPYTVQLQTTSSWTKSACLRVVEITQGTPPMLTILNSKYPEKIEIPADATGLRLVFFYKPRWGDATDEKYNILPYNNRDEFLKNVNLTPTDNYIDKHSVFIVLDTTAADIINNILGKGCRWQMIAEPNYGGARRKSKKVKKSRKQRKSIKNRKTKHSKK
jgi:hypothetical protein